MGAADVDRLVRLVDELRAENAALKARNDAVVPPPVDKGVPAAASPGEVPHDDPLAVAIEKTRTPMVLSDPNLPDNPIVFANRAFRAMSGYSADEILGRNCRFLQGPGTSPAAVEALRDAIANRRDVTVDLVNHRKDGSSFLNELFVSPVYGADGALRYFFGCQTDATAYRDTARRLAGSEAYWRRRFDRLHEGFMVGEVLRDGAGVPVDWRIVEVNDAFERMTGLVRQSILGRTGRSALPKLDEDWVSDLLHTGETGEPRTVTRWVKALGRAYEANIFQAEPGQFGVLFQDATDRLREEARNATLLKLSDILREDLPPEELAYRAAALLGQSFGVSRAGYGTIDPVAETITVVRDWNAPGTRTIAGTLRFRDHGSYIDDLKRGITVAIPDTRLDPRTTTTTDVLEAISARSFVNMPVTEEDGFVALLYLNHRDARAWSPEELALVREVAERTRVAVERRRAEQQLRELTASLEAQVEARTKDLLATEEVLRQSQKMEAVGQLTGGIAHDFNNLLTGITGSLELLTTRLAQGRVKDLDRYVAAAQGAARRAAALTHRLLAFSRRQTLDPRPTAINGLVAGMEDLIRRTIGPAIALGVAGEAGLWPSLVDPNQLENALLNLCINARDAMPDGGRLFIEASNASLDGDAARERDMVPGEYVALAITDTGTGMSPETVSRVFDPFFTTKPLGQGTGLGLSMVYGFVHQTGGQIRIRSAVGQGTTMSLYLPRHDGGRPTEEPGPEASSMARTRGEGTVLVIDDEPTVRLLVTEVLEEIGFRAIQVTDGVAGLQVLQSDAQIDLLVTDVGLPGGLNGRQVADAARSTRPGLKVLFITGYAEKAAIGDGQMEPGMHVLTKPFAVEALAGRIRDLLADAPRQEALTLLQG